MGSMRTIHKETAIFAALRAEGGMIGRRPSGPLQPKAFKYRYNLDWISLTNSRDIFICNVCLFLISFVPMFLFFFIFDLCASSSVFSLMTWLLAPLGLAMSIQLS